MRYNAFLALGSNMGDRVENLLNAVRYISELENTEVSAVSNIYETEPVGYTDQNKFLNMAAGVRTDLGPLDLLKETQKIENLLKRTREIHWGPRTIDIDILLYGEMKIDLPDLTVPHPRMFERAFVLVPLKEIYPQRTIFGRNIGELIDDCEDRYGVRQYLNMLNIKN